jgi:hypothetical protein
MGRTEASLKKALMQAEQDGAQGASTKRTKSAKQTQPHKNTRKLIVTEVNNIQNDSKIIMRN